MATTPRTGHHVPAMDPDPSIDALLQRWHAGDREALAEIVQLELPFVREHVHRRLGDRLRERAQTEDFVQDAMVDVLRNGPRFAIAGRAQLRALLARIVENVLCDAHERAGAKKRGGGRDQALPSDSVLERDRPARSVTSPSEAAQRGERAAWVRLALELLEPEDRRVVYLRQWLDLPFEEVGARLGLSPDTARMRFNRALPRLAQKLELLRAGRLAEAIGP
jgi:RNA polymerase sigma factor (sigma-70 family)